MTYPTDAGRLYFFLIVSVVLAVYIIIKRKEMEGSYKGGLIVTSIGILLLLISIAGICTTEGHWDSDFILAFLSFKVVSAKMGIGGLYYLRAMAYTIVMFGMGTLIFGLMRKT